jgi:hypothetical protein
MPSTPAPLGAGDVQGTGYGEEQVYEGRAPPQGSGSSALYDDERTSALLESLFRAREEAPAAEEWREEAPQHRRTRLLLRARQKETQTQEMHSPRVFASGKRGS